MVNYFLITSSSNSVSSYLQGLSK